MDFEWDPEKSNRCYLERGFDFAYAAQGFFDPDRIVIKDNRYDYGEPPLPNDKQNPRACICGHLYATFQCNPHHISSESQPEGGETV
jgi:uncharacterized DUF497 family protein